LRPDVVTLDLQMPGMDGLEVLDAMLDKDPVPVIMVSSLTKSGAVVTLDALDRGATDYVAKPDAGAECRALFIEELLHKIRTAACIDVKRLLSRRKRKAEAAPEPAPGPAKAKASAEECPPEFASRCIALGISTGGPPALTRLLSSLKPPMPPMVIVQHMPPQFTGPLAQRLDSISALTVQEATQGDRLQPNRVLVAPGGRHVQLRGRGTHVTILLKDGPVVSGHKPSVDVMMTTAAEAYGSNCLGVIMTGMGRDGVDGCRAIRAAGGFVLGQNEATSDVYGMNRAAYVEGHVDRQFSLQDGAAMISQQVRRLGAAMATT
jgi:two-component system chemotaxis response regulator CheB